MSIEAAIIFLQLKMTQRPWRDDPRQAAVVSNNSQTTPLELARITLGPAGCSCDAFHDCLRETVGILTLYARGAVSFHDETVIGLADDIALAISTSINKRGSWTHSTHSQTAASRRLWLERLSQYSALRLTANR
jgi:hypothetical protein